MHIFRALWLLFCLAGGLGAATLATDEHLGKVVDAQGAVSLKPAEHQRWTPVCGPLLLMPGDRLRTDLRGANAAEVHLQSGGKLILGPGSLVELVKAGEIRVYSGELEATPAPKQPLRMSGPQKQIVVVETSSNLRIDGDKLITIEHEPKWLQGFKGTIKNETLGSLVAKIDGRDVPLTIGYHKVTVDIRDQIARTVIEQSFVNHTDAQLEGVFYFPLPADASISGFGMWIGNELVEADVVEKQRAREIYETILRERRDPGLLEWSGGNLFKARVYPIPPRGEKRIKISYTQVLPLRGRTYRYSYALESELLKQHPLAELSLDVKINSTLPLANVSCGTHACRVSRTAHAGHVEFSTQEYTPDRDFEVAVELDRGRPDVVLVPHQRAGDGYFLLMISPPGADTAWQREVLADGEPLRLLILTDTSGSMDASLRKTQDAFLAALLGSLGSRDTFNLAACDVHCDWVSPDDLAADEKNVSRVRDFLAGRRSLGWTNLDEAFAAVLKRTRLGTHVIYIGDGIVTAPDADPAAFVNRLRRLTDGQPGTFHAVACGSKFELPVLKAIGAVGGGSLRKIQAGAAASSETGPAAVARQLLAELTQPGLADLKIEFTGLRTARVYPEQLPNVPLGTQQIVLGRYLPEGKTVAGQVIVTARQGEETVRLRADVSVPDAEQGNSFIPRLWARQHLDALLEQGGSQSIQDEIIALSEEYQIITPYTSFLVLETDADRERFKVKRRFQMRDGQKFFAAGRDQASYELVQQQMKRAGGWRLNLRNQILADLARMGRNPQLFQSQYIDYSICKPVYEIKTANVNYTISKPVYDTWSSEFETDTGRLNVNAHLGMEGMGGGHFPLSKTAAVDGLYFGDRPELLISETHAWHDRRAGDLSGDGEYLGDSDGYDDPGSTNQLLGTPAGEPAEWNEVGGPADSFDSGGQVLPSPWYQTDDVQYFASADYDAKSTMIDYPAASTGYNAPLGRWRRSPAGGMGMGWGMGGGRGLYNPYRSLLSWWQSILPPLAAEPAAETPIPAEKAWPAEARAISQSLLRASELAKIEGLVFDSQVDSFDARRAALTQRAFEKVLLGGESWVAVHSGDAAQTVVDWADGKQRGVYSRLYELGRVRASGLRDRTTPPLSLCDYSLVSLERSFLETTPKLEVKDENRTLVTLSYPHNAHYEARILVDTRRHVVLSAEQFQNGKLSSAVRFSDFVEIAGRAWATRVESFDDRERRTELVTLKIEQGGAEEIAQRMQDQLKDRPQMLLLDEPLPSVAAAKQAVAAGKATVSDHMALVAHFAASQQWPRVDQERQAVEQLAQGKESLKWISDSVLFASRKHEELKGRLQAQSAAAAERKPDGNQLALANSLVHLAGQVLEAHEMLRLIDVLRPAFEHHPDHVSSMRQWNSYRATYLQSSGQPDRALALERKLAEEYPTDYGLQQQYAQALANQGDYEGALAWLRRTLASDFEWLDHERDALRELLAQFLESQTRFDELTEFLADWVAQNPADASPYGHYLFALLRTGHEQQADKLLRRWLRQGTRAKNSSSPAACRLQAAMRQALGHGRHNYTNRIDPRWLEPLAKTAIRLARNPELVNMADEIMSHQSFQSSDEARACRKYFASLLLEKLDTLSPGQAGYLVGWVLVDDPPVDATTWKRITAGLERRWVAEAEPDGQHAWAPPLIQVLSRPAPGAELLAFLERQLRATHPEYHAADANELFDALLAQPWSPATEDRAFELLAEISDDPQAQRRLLAQVDGLHRLIDRLLAGRTAANLAEVEHAEDLTRTELIAKRREASRQAREGLADRLTRERGKPGEPLAPWLAIERIWLDVQLKRELDKVAADIWEFLGVAPRKLDPQPDETVLGQILAGRYLATAAYLAASPQAKPQWTERLLAYLQAGIDQQPDKPLWKMETFRLLVALDRPQQLEALLRDWIRPELADNTWRVALGYLLAEQGKLDEAIRLFAKVETDDELGPAEYGALANWYLAKDEKQQHERALVASYAATDENSLGRWLTAKTDPWCKSGKVPAELDAETLRLFAALLKKSTYPQNYLGRLLQVYQNSRDFRLLECVADSALGHTALAIYPYLQATRQVLGEVRDEATIDKIGDRLKTLREQVKTDVDRRALDLLELLVERRAAELQNQPGPHVERAVAALQRSAQGEWQPGERRLMADLLAGMGPVAAEPLAAAQIKLLTQLYRDSDAGSFDRLAVAQDYAATLWNRSRWNESLDVFQAALDEFRAASGGVLPESANNALTTYVGYLENREHFARGEAVLLAELKPARARQQRAWRVQRLYQLYTLALAGGGTVSLGEGRSLYRNVADQLDGDLNTEDVDHQHQLIVLACGLYRTAHAKHIEGVVANLQTLAEKRLPNLLRFQTNNYPALVGTVADTLHDLAGARPALAFLIERMEQEPHWLSFSNESRWSGHGQRCAQWRLEVKQLGDLEPRLLALVVDELKLDLRTRDARNRGMYTIDNPIFYWAEKADDFARAADEVLAERPDSAARILSVTNYLYNGLHRYGHALEILAAADRRNRLDEAGRAQMVNYLQWQSRWQESIRPLLALMELRPVALHYRTQLMQAYFQTKQPDKLLGLLKQTDKYFHDERHWNESTIDDLAASTLLNGLYTQSVAYYREAISLHERTQPNRGIGGETLPTYYVGLSQALSELNRTTEAVDAACAAIVSWGPRKDHRTEALNELYRVLRTAKDLAKFEKTLDEQVVASGLENPIVRKALGQALLEQHHFDAAIRQLKKAAEAQPSDPETCRALVSAYDAAQQPKSAIEQLLALAALTPRDIQLYKDIGDRCQELKDPADAERARTTIIEALPGEAESHALLAKIREAQERWSEAAGQWQAVARLRALEPTGLVKLAEAQIRLKQWTEAGATLHTLSTTAWPERFGDIGGQIHELQQRVENRSGSNRPGKPGFSNQDTESQR